MGKVTGAYYYYMAHQPDDMVDRTPLVVEEEVSTELSDENSSSMWAILAGVSIAMVVLMLLFVLYQKAAASSDSKPVDSDEAPGQYQILAGDDGDDNSEDTDNSNQIASNV